MPKVNRKSVLILGSTGSVGTNAIDIIMNNRHLFDVKAIVAGSNADKVTKQAIDLGVQKVALLDHKAGCRVREILANRNTANFDNHAGLGPRERSRSGPSISYPGLMEIDIEVFSGLDAILDLCSGHYDIAISAITGIAGLLPTLQAIRSSDLVAIANKESIVCGGHILLSEARLHGTKIIPLDSEHHAIYRILGDEGDREKKNYKQLASIVLTASGGPFWFKSKEEMDEAKITDVLRHPTWDMGPKITIDCATMMNKGLEVIEAAYLFDIPIDQIDILVHPESLIHGIINLHDGSSISYLSPADMRISIAHALSLSANDLRYRHKCVDLAKLANLRFFSPDYCRFPLLRLAREAFTHSVQAMIVLNAINEKAVQKFLDGKIAFSQISLMVIRAMDDVNTYKNHDISTVQGVLELHNKIIRKDEVH